jgi:hypothetical protein
MFPANLKPNKLIEYFFLLLKLTQVARCNVMVKTLCYKPESRGFEIL